MIFGENGSGKTSVLESIYLLSMGKSFKTNKQKEMIKNGEDKTIINGSFVKEDVMNKIDIMIDSNSTKTIKVNGKKVFNRNDLLGYNNVVVLSPEEQKITKGSAKQRRMFFDKLFSITSNKYLKVLQDYSKVLKHRNKMLKNNLTFNGFDKKLEPWNDIIIQKGLNLWKQRCKKLIDFRDLFNSKFESAMISAILESL
mgnify:CR=1 FL=1